MFCPNTTLCALLASSLLPFVCAVLKYDTEHDSDAKTGSLTQKFKISISNNGPEISVDDIVEEDGRIYPEVEVVTVPDTDKAAYGFQVEAHMFVNPEVGTWIHQFMRAVPLI